MNDYRLRNAAAAGQLYRHLHHLHILPGPGRSVLASAKSRHHFTGGGDAELITPELTNTRPMAEHRRPLLFRAGGKFECIRIIEMSVGVIMGIDVSRRLFISYERSFFRPVFR